MAQVDTSIYGNLLRAPKSPEEYATERQQLQASELSNALNRQKVDAYSKEQNLLNTFRAARQRGASADELVGIGDFEGAKERQTFDTNKVDESRKAEKWMQEKAKYALEVRKQLAGRVMANPSAAEAMAAIAEMERLTGQSLDSERQRIAMLQTTDQLRQWAAGHALEADKLLPKFDSLNLGGIVQDRMIDPVTGKAIVTGASKVTLTPAQAAQLSQDDRQFKQSMDLRRQEFEFTKNKDAQDRADKKAAATGADGKPLDLKEGQAKATAFLGQMRSAQKVLDQIGGDSTDLRSQVGVAMAGGKANIAAGAKNQQVKQAQNQWSEAYLRFKTGAAATEPEVQLNNATFFPKIGDSAEVVAQKKAARLQAERDMEIVAGPGAAALSTPRNEAGANGAPKRISSDAEYNALPPGATFIDPNGKTRRKP